MVSANCVHYHENYRRGLPYITGLLILDDPETGIPVAVMDCVWITATRTGAATAVAAKYLARPDSKAIDIMSCPDVGHWILVNGCGPASTSDVYRASSIKHPVSSLSHTQGGHQ